MTPWTNTLGRFGINTPAPLLPWDRSCAVIYVALQRPPAPLLQACLTLAASQGGRCFSFGTKGQPLGVGVLLRICDLDSEASGPCPVSGDEGVATAVYRLLNLRHINKEAAQVLLTQQKQADEFFKKLRRDRPAVEQGAESLSSQLVEWALKALKADRISRKKALELAGKAHWKAPEFEKWAKAMGWERCLRGPKL